MVPRHPDVTFVNLDLLTYAGNPMNIASLEEAGNYELVQGDVTDSRLIRTLFEKHSFTTVVHFAAETHVDRSVLAPLYFARTNTLGTVTLLEAAREAWNEADLDSGRFRFYNVSTDEVYGSLGDDGAFSEETPYDPRSPYSASKASGDHFVRAYFHTYGLPVIISNCSNNYGPYQFPEKLIPLVLVRALNHQSVPIYGTGENVRDWLYVEDHCEAIETLLYSGADGQTYVVGGGAECTNLDIVRMLLDLLDGALGRVGGTSRELITFVKDRPGHDFRYAMDFSKIRNEFGWAPRHDLEAGLRATVQWYLDHPSWLDAVLDDSYRDYVDRQYVRRTS
jgi:dTDP-glucose 4,6-dehydratase